MSERHPMIYNEFDIEAARKAGHEDERNRIIRLLESLHSEWAAELQKQILLGNNYEVARYRNCVLACADLLDEIMGNGTIKGEQK